MFRGLGLRVRFKVEGVGGKLCASCLMALSEKDIRNLWPQCPKISAQDQLRLRLRRLRLHSPTEVDGMWIYGDLTMVMVKSIFYLLKGTTGLK